MQQGKNDPIVVKAEDVVAVCPTNILLADTVVKEKIITDDSRNIPTKEKPFHSRVFS